ncbi:MAG TPA: hypothetical protein VFQ67_13900 [Allosphingosinicella sp.]|jgi:hypothetical protein|nr:hypothetical protein [Allosphingosinicella sp.]
MQSICAVAAAALALLAPVAAPARPKAPASAAAVSPAEQARLKEIGRRGALLYAYDQAAWHGTDDMVAKLPDYQSRVGGWIVDGPADAPELIFFDREASRPVYVARFRDGKLVSGEVAGPGAGELSAPRRSLVAARKAALEAFGRSGSKGCSDAPMNSVVLPPAAPGEPVLVYFLTPQRVTSALPFGGHYMVPVNSAGTAGAVRRFTNSCLELPLPGARDRKRVAALAVTHLLDPLPTEIHVFSSLAAHLPVIVGTKDGRSWWVEGGAINFVHEAGR